MKYILKSSAVLLAILLLHSCNFEKRLYRSGYYNSSVEKIKSHSAVKQTPKFYSESLIQEDASASAVPEAPAPNTIQNIKELQLEYKVSGLHEKNLKPKTERTHKTQALPKVKKKKTLDNEKTPSDVKMLLLIAVGSVLTALFYGLFSLSNILWAANTFFILTPFAIIGIWIFALLLFTKYRDTALSNESDQKQKKERIITKRKAFLLAGFLGIFGAHRFYLGYTEIGILEMLTLGGFFVLFFIDLIRIKNGMLKPKKGDYDQDDSTYTKHKKKAEQTNTQKFIKIALLISFVALIILLGFGIFL